MSMWCSSWSPSSAVPTRAGSSVPWPSPGMPARRPVVVLTKTDLCDDVGDGGGKAREGAPFSEIMALSAVDGRWVGWAARAPAVRRPPRSLSGRRGSASQR